MYCKLTKGAGAFYIIVAYIKKIIAFIICFLIFLSVLQTQTVLINEVVADPGMYDGQGGEWIELYSAAGQDVSRYVITDGEEIIIIPDGTIIPAGGFLLIYNSTFFNCTYCNWDPAIIANLPASTITLDVSTCDCTNQRSSNCYAVTYENAGLPPSNSNNGERIVLFDENATIIDAVYYGDGGRVNGGAAIPESQIANSDGDADIITGLNIIGNLANLGFILPASNDYSIPAVIGDGTDNGIYTYIGLNPVSCSCSNSRNTDGGSSTNGNGFFLDLYPSPGQTNTTQDFVITYTTSDGESGTLTPDEDISIDICGSATISFQADIYGFNQIYNDSDGDAGGSVVPSGNGSFIEDTGGFIAGQAAWSEASVTSSGVTTLTYTSPSITGNTVIDFQIKENTQAANLANTDQSCATGVTGISGSGNGEQCYIRRSITVNQKDAITAISYTCTNGLITVTTTPDTDFGNYDLFLDNSADDGLDQTLTVTSSPFQFQVTEGTDTDYALSVVAGSQTPNCGALPVISGPGVCVFTPPCPDFGGYDACTDAEGDVCPGDNINISIDVDAASDLPDGATIEYIVVNSAAATEAEIYAATEVLATQTVTTTTTTAKDCSDLTAGDIMIVSMNTSDPDEFCFVTLVPIAANTSFYITDDGLNADESTFNASNNEGVISWTAPATPVTAGTVVCITGTSITMSYPGTVSIEDNGFSLRNNGEQILIFCGSEPMPDVFIPSSFLAGATTSDWLTTGTPGLGTSYLPSSLNTANAYTDLSDSGTINNGEFTCGSGSESDTRANLIALINNNDNWTTSSSNLAPIPPCNWTVTDLISSTLTLSCATITVPADQCSDGDLFIAARISPSQEGCNTTTGASDEFPTAAVRTYSVTCPTATISGERAICAGSTAEIPITFTNITGCTDADITYTIDGGSSTTVNVTISANMGIITGLTTAGLYEITAVTLNGCTGLCTVDISGSINLQIQALPSTPTAVNQTVCNNQLSILTATGDIDLVWYDGDPTSGGTQIGTGEMLNVTLTTGTTYYVRSESPDNGCFGTAVPVVISVAELPTATANDIEVCVGNQIDLVGSAAGGTGSYSYEWTTTSSNNFTSNEQNPTVTTTAATSDAGTYTLYVEDTNGCFDTTDATVTVNTLPNVDLAVSDASACSSVGLDVTFTISNAESGITYTLQTGGMDLSPSVTGTGTGTDLDLTILQANVPTTTTTYTLVASNSSTNCSANLIDQPTLTITNVSCDNTSPWNGNN